MSELKAILRTLVDGEYNLKRNWNPLKDDFVFRVQSAFQSSRLDEELKQLITQKLNQINFNGEARYAVRSSGVTEDSEESSAAGQNETFLGVKSNEDVFEAVVKCWASLFSFQSVKYRK